MHLVLGIQRLFVLALVATLFIGCSKRSDTHQGTVHPNECENVDCGPNAHCYIQHEVQCACDEGYTECEEDCIPETEACDETEPLECTPGERRCEGSQVQECNEEGTGWDVIETCMGECFDGTCLDPCGHHQDKLSYLGCTFWAVPLQNQTQSAQEDFAVTISSHGNLPIEIAVQTAAGEEVETTTIEPGALVTVPLQSFNQITGTGITQQSYRINTTGKVTIHQFNPINDINIHSSDASLLLPLGALGHSYRVIAWPTELYTIGMTTPCTISSDCLFSTQWCNEELGECEGPVAVGSSQITVVATSFEPTSIEITSPIRVEIRDSNGASVTYPENQSFDLEIQRGDVLTLSTLIEAGADLTGLEITANHEVAVFSSNTCAMIPHGTFACDHLEQQLFPTATWGTQYVGAKFKPRGDEPDVWRVLANTNGTTLSSTPAISALQGVTLDAGEFVEFEWNKDFVLDANHPISMAQFMVSADYPGPSGGCIGGGLVPGPATDRENCAIPSSSICGSQAIGDPAFLTNVPSSQFRTTYTVLVPGDYIENYLTFIVPINETISLDGSLANMLPTPIGTTDWGTITMPVTSGIHTAWGSAEFGLISYGYDCTVSYAYPGGLNLEISE